MVFFLPISLSGVFSRTGNLAFKFCQGWVWWGRICAGVTIDARRNPAVDPKQSYVIISNHQSLYDIPALMLGVGLQFRWVIKKSYIYAPLFGWALYLARHVFIDRSNPKQSIRSMEEARAVK